MKTSQICNYELLGRGTLGLLVITGVAFSAIAFLVLDEGIQNIVLANEVKSTPINICENGLCYIKDVEDTSNQILVQQGEDSYPTQQVSNNEDFSNLKIVKNIPGKEPKITGNKVTLFAQKDSFIREAIQNSNEGSNQVLKILGAGPTNNRVLVAFNQADIQDVATDKIIESATLKLYVESNNHNWGDGQLISIHRLETNWSEGIGISVPVSSQLNTENGVTWSCPMNAEHCSDWDGGKFNQNPTDSIWISNQVEDYWIKFDVSKDILDYLDAEENFGWIIIKSDEESGGQINIASRERQSHTPELMLVFSDD